MRILLVNQAFWPDTVATAQHMDDLARHLASGGHRVTIIASRSRYGQTPLPPPSPAPPAHHAHHVPAAPGVFPARECRDGMDIHRVGVNRFPRRRVLDFGAFLLLGLLRAVRLPRQDVVVCLTTPPFIGVVGMVLKSCTGARYVQYEMDLYPDLPIALGHLPPSGLRARCLEGLHRKLLRSADRVVVLGRCMERALSAKGIPNGKMLLVTPWADPVETVAPDRIAAFRKKHGLPEKFTIMYAGHLGLAHDIDTMLSAIERLAGDAAIHFVFAGGGTRIREFQQRLSADAPVTFLPHVERDELPELLAAADLHLVSQHPATTGLLVPSKFYGILAAERPVLYIGPPDTEIANTLREHPLLGEIVLNGDGEALARAICRRRAGPPPDPAVFREVLRDHGGGHSRGQCVERLAAAIDALRTQAAGDR